MTEYLIQNKILNSTNEIQDGYCDSLSKAFLQYIGSKRKLITHIVKYFRGHIIVDLMAGTHSLGYFLKDKKKVIANDIMQYSYLIGKAIVESSILKLKPLKIEYNGSYNFFEKNYSGTYFTTKQCQDLDAIKYTIEKLENKNLKACYYSCVFNILDRIGATAGHFDGFLKKNTEKARRRKNKNVIDYFEREIKCFQNKINKFGSVVYNIDGIELLDQIKKVDTIYIDPPYNHRQYSTLYHILEMFARYNGKLKNCLYKYPEKRYFSPYSYKSKAESAFNNLLRKSSEVSNQVIFSYSNKGIVSIKKLKNIFEKYFDITFIEKFKYYHRQQKTSQGNGIVTEYIFTLNN